MPVIWFSMESLRFEGQKVSEDGCLRLQRYEKSFEFHKIIKEMLGYKFDMQSCWNSRNFFLIKIILENSLKIFNILLSCGFSSNLRTKFLNFSCVFCRKQRWHFPEFLSLFWIFPFTCFPSSAFLHRKIRFSFPFGEKN